MHLQRNSPSGLEVRLVCKLLPAHNDLALFYVVHSYGNFRLLESFLFHRTSAVALGFVDGECGRAACYLVPDVHSGMHSDDVCARWSVDAAFEADAREERMTVKSVRSLS